MSHFDKCCRGSRQSAVLSVHKTELSLELQVLNWDQAKASSLDVVLRKAGADHGSSKTPSNELLDQRNAAKLHRDPQVVAEGIEDAFQGLPRGPSFGKDEWHFGNFGQRDDLLAGEWMAGLNDQLQLVAEHPHDAQRAALYWECDDSDVDSASLDLLDDLPAEIPVHADSNRWILRMETLEHFRQHVEERRFVGANREYAARLLRCMRKR